MAATQNQGHKGGMPWGVGCARYLEAVVEEREVSLRIYILVDIKKIKGSFSKKQIKRFKLGLCGVIAG